MPSLTTYQSLLGQGKGARERWEVGILTTVSLNSREIEITRVHANIVIIK